MYTLVPVAERRRWHPESTEACFYCRCWYGSEGSCCPDRPPLRRTLQAAGCLLERQEVDRLLREQRTALFGAGGDRDSALAVQTGRLWATDVFLMLESVRGEDRLQRVRVRLVDAWYGIKIHEYTFIEPKGDEFENTAALVVRNACARIVAVNRDAGEMLLVGVMGVENVGLSRQWDYLAEILGSMIEQGLSRESGIILLERQRVGALLEERGLVSGLPDTLRASMILVDGEYEYNQSGGTLIVRARSRRDGKLIGTTECSGLPDSIEQLAADVTKGILRDFKAPPSTVSMDPAWEADMLLQQAFATRDYSYALSSAEAAMMLVPQRQDVKLAYLRLLYLWRGYKATTVENQSCPDQAGWNGWSRGTDGAPNEWALYRAKRYVSVLGRFIANWHSNGSGTYEPERIGYGYLKIPRCEMGERSPGNSVYYLPMMLDFLIPADYDRQTVRDLITNELKPLLLDILHQDQLPTKVALGMILKHWPGDAANYVEKARAYLAEDSRAIFLSAFLNTGNMEVIQRVEAILMELAQSSHIHEQRRGKFGLFYLAARPQANQDFEKTRLQFEDYKAFILRNAVHQNSEFNNPYLIMMGILVHSGGSLNAAVYNLFYEDKEEDLQYRAKQVEEILEHVFAHNLFKYGAWWSHFGSVPLILEKAGRPAVARDLLQRSIDKITNIVEAEAGLYRTHFTRNVLESHKQNMRVLLDKHPELANDNLSASEDEKGAGCAAVSLLSLNQMRSAVGGRSLSPVRVVVSGGEVQIVCSEGVLRLGINDFDILRFDSCPPGSSIKWHGYLATDDGYLVADDGNIYAYGSKGVLEFLADGESRLIQGTGVDGVGNVQAMDVLNNKLYLVVDDSQSLLEVDLETGEKRMILSSRRQVGGQDYSSGKIYGLASHRMGNRLLLYVYISGKPGLHAYDPMTGELGDGMLCLPGSSKFRNGDHLVVVDWRSVYFWDLAEDRYLARLKAASYRFDARSSHCLLGKHILCINNPKIEMFALDGGAAEEMMPRFFPGGEYDKRPQPRDLAAYGDDDLLLLMDDGLYIVRGLRERLAVRKTERDGKQ